MARVGDVIEFAGEKFLPVQARPGGDVPVYGSGGLIDWHDEPVVTGPTVPNGLGSASGLCPQTRPLDRLAKGYRSRMIVDAMNGNVKKRHVIR